MLALSLPCIVGKGARNGTFALPPTPIAPELGEAVTVLLLCNGVDMGLLAGDMYVEAADPGGGGSPPPSGAPSFTCEPPPAPPLEPAPHACAGVTLGYVSKVRPTPSGAEVARV